MAEDGRRLPREVRDWQGRSYRVGEDPRDLTGWPRWTMLAAAWSAMAAVGMLQYGYGAAVPSLMARNGWSLAEVFWVLAAWAVFQAGVGFPAAYLRDTGRLGPRGMCLIGAGCCEAGLLALAYSTSLPLVLAGYSVVGGTGAGLVYAACTSTVARWYPERSAARVGMVTGAYAYGSVPVIVAAATGLSGSSLAGSVTVVAVAVFMIVAAAGQVLTDPPDGWWPAHVDPQGWALGAGRNHGRRRNPAAVREFSAPQALRTRALPVMLVILLGAGAVSLFDAAFVVVIVTGAGAGPVLVAIAAALVAGVNGGSRAIAVGVSDRLGRCRTLAAALGVQAAGQVLFAIALAAHSPVALVAAAAVAGLGGGAFYPLFACLAREYFGEDRALQVHGVVYSAKAGSGVLGIGLAAGALTAWGPVPTFLVAAMIGAGSAWATHALRRPGLPDTLPRPQVRLASAPTT